MRLLLVEDALRLARVIAAGLQRVGFAVDCVDTVEAARAAVEEVAFDAIVLDRGLPDGDGLMLVHWLREQGNATPVLVLTARDTVDDRVEGLDSGSDDYLLKPFAMKELVARLRALLRRPGGALGVTLAAGNLSFDSSARELRVGERPIAISRREMSVLEQLLRRHGHVVSREFLEEKLYGADSAVTSNSIEVHISRLRKRLAKAGATVKVHTLRGVGYLLSEEA